MCTGRQLWQWNWRRLTTLLCSELFFFYCLISYVYQCWWWIKLIITTTNIIIIGIHFCLRFGSMLSNCYYFFQTFFQYFFQNSCSLSYLLISNPVILARLFSSVRIIDSSMRRCAAWWRVYTQRPICRIWVLSRWNDGWADRARRVLSGRSTVCNSKMNDVGAV